MGTITKQFTFSSGTVIVASEHNTNFNTIYDEFNGNIDDNNIKESASILASKLNLSTISQNITFTGNNTFSGTTISDLGTVTTVDINGGTIDGTNIGSSSKGTAGFSSLVLNSGSTVISILDEDDMVSDSDTSLATQQSIKSYVDSSVNFELFTSSGTFTAPSSVNFVKIIIIGGGAGGGGDSGYGGGAGAYLETLIEVTPSGNHSVTVGLGGSGNTGGGSGNDGGNSSFVGKDYTLTINGGDGGDGGGIGSEGLGGVANTIISLDATGTGSAPTRGYSGNGFSLDGGNGSTTIRGPGGNSPLGTGGSGGGGNATGYGSGGGGGASGGGDGGDGRDGIVIISW